MRIEAEKPIPKYLQLKDILKQYWVVVTLYVIVMARSPRRSHLDGIASQSLAMTPSCTVYHYPEVFLGVLGVLVFILFGVLGVLVVKTRYSNNASVSGSDRF